MVGDQTLHPLGTVDNLIPRQSNCWCISACTKVVDPLNNTAICRAKQLTTRQWVNHCDVFLYCDEHRYGGLFIWCQTRMPNTTTIFDKNLQCPAEYNIEYCQSYTLKFPQIELARLSLEPYSIMSMSFPDLKKLTVLVNNILTLYVFYHVLQRTIISVRCCHFPNT